LAAFFASKAAFALIKSSTGGEKAAAARKKIKWSAKIN
jgi:hypothetical protein